MSAKWKIQYFKRFMGRGNPWIKIPYSSPAKKIILKRLARYESLGGNTKNYIEACDRHSFFWLRYSKVSGTQSNPCTLFEIRFNGSKIQHKENIIAIPSKIADRFELLGGTPFRLKLESTDEIVHSIIPSTDDNHNNSSDAVQTKENETLLKPVFPSCSFALPGKQDIEKFKQFLLKEKAL
jgi:hypothetical protein